MKATCNRSGTSAAVDPYFELTPWMTTPPIRPGLYVAGHNSMRSFWDGTTWSALVDEAASKPDYKTARATRVTYALPWRGLTKCSHDWLAREMTRG